MNPTISITGIFHLAGEKSFTDKDGKDVNFYQVAILTDDEYRPIMYFTTTKEVLDEADLLSKEAHLHRGEEVTLSGHLSTASREVNGVRVQIPKVKIDTSITFS